MEHSIEMMDIEDSSKEAQNDDQTRNTDELSPKAAENCDKSPKFRATNETFVDKELAEAALETCKAENGASPG